MQTDERVILVDECDRELGAAGKLRAHREGALHRAFSVFIFDGAGRLLLQRRARGKYHSGGLWSNTACGHPRPGEQTGEAARRRLREEMSLDCELREAFEFVYRAELDGSLVEHEYDHVFVGTHDEEPAPDPAEVEEWRWVSMNELRRGLTEEPESYSYWLKVAVEGEHWAKLEALGVGGGNGRHASGARRRESIRRERSMSKAVTKDEKLEKLREIVKAVDICMLTTVDEGGDLHSRPMSNNRDVEFDGDLWFFTYGSSHKVDEVGRVPKVNASFADVDAQLYASLSGEAEVVRDRAKVEELWKPELRAWFPDGVDTPDIALLKVTVDRAEYWDGSQSLVAHAVGLVSSLVKGEPAQLGENEKLDLK